MFFKNLKPKDSVQLSLTWSENLESLYKTKYDSTLSWKSYIKQ
ncbi:fragment of hypothetical protein [Tenacibaculum xiamenense]